MKNKYLFFLLTLLWVSNGWAQHIPTPEASGLLQPFFDDVEMHADFEQDDLEGWTSLDLDGFNTGGSFHSFPGKGGPLGFIVYTPSETDPPNVFQEYAPRSGKKYFASISSFDGPVNDWLISDELAEHPGGTFSFYAKTSFDYAGDDEFKVAYSTTTANPEDFIFLNDGNTISPSSVWAKFEFEIPADAKHVAINSVSQAVMLLIDDIAFTANVADLAPGIITDLSIDPQLGADIQAEFTWTNPTVDKEGNPLTEMTGVKVFRGTHPMNLAEITDISATVGETMTYLDLLPVEGSYLYRFVPYNNEGDGVVYNTPLTFFGYETIPGAPRNITFTQDSNLHTVISWDEVNYGENGGTLENPVVGYTITRALGSTTDTLATMHPSTSFTEADIPELNLYTYTITAQTSPENFGIPAVVTDYSGLGEDQVSVTSGDEASNQVFELGRGSIISQSIYTPEDIGSDGLITSLSYFGNLGASTTAHYKVYMSLTQRETFGTTLNNAVWEYFGDQKLLFDGDIEFSAGRKAVTIDLDQPFYYDSSNNENVIITIVKPLLENPPNINPREFANTPVEGMRTYYANTSVTDLSLITTQPAAWSTDEVPTIPSVAVGKRTDYASLSGEVTLMDDASPIEEVTVTITPADLNSYQTETTYTDETGLYLIPALIPGNYVVSFAKDGYNTYEEAITIEANEQHILDAELEEALVILISGSVLNEAGNPLEDINLNLSGFSTFTTLSDADGNFTLEAYAEKEYDLEVVHPLYHTESLSFTSEADDYTLDPITLTLDPRKPGDVMAVNNDGVGEVAWRIPVGYSNETTIGWGSFINVGNAWGNGSDPFISGIRFEPSDILAQVPEDAELTHVKAYIANNAEIIIHVYEGENAEELIHSQSASIHEEDWYLFELTTSIEIDPTKELWIGIEFLAGEYGAYPIGLDDGPNAPSRKGSMLYEHGVWRSMSLTNANWNIYGIVNNTLDADPHGYKVYRSPAEMEEWTELTASIITDTNYNDTTLVDAEPNSYKYGITAHYDGDLVSEKGISNVVEHNMFFNFSLEVDTDSGSAEGAYVAMWNEENFAEAFVPASETVTFNELLRGEYNLRVELDNYTIVERTDILVEDSGTINIPLNLLKVQPSNLTAILEGTASARLDWTLHNTYTDQFEKYEDFERETIGDYILKDLDGLETHTFINFDWPNAGDPMSFMVFNPFATTPPTSIESFSGRRFLASVANFGGPNNDWVIIPAGSGNISFMAKSLVGAEPERINVLYSTTGSEVSDFTAFGNVVSVPGVWTEYSFEAPEETKYVAINNVSNDTYILKIDDLTYEKQYSHALSYNIYLDEELIAEDVTTTSFLLEDLITGSHIAEVEAVYSTGFSEKTAVEIIMLDIDNPNTTEFQVYPNPSNGRFLLDLMDDAEVSIYDLHGRILYSDAKKAGTSRMEHNFSSGTYIIQVKSEKGTSSKKLIFR